MRKIYSFLRLASRLANPFGHPSQVRTQVLVLQTCVDLRRLASPFGHPSQVRTQVLVLQTCVDLRRLASQFGPGLSNQTRTIGRSLPAVQPISTRKAQSRKKPTNLCAPRAFLQQMCLPCLIQSCYFDYRINKPFTCSHCLICVSCSVHVISHVLRAQRLMGSFYLTHNSTRSENPTTWKNCDRKKNLSRLVRILLLLDNFNL